MLPFLRMPTPPYLITFEWGVSNMQSDWDNPVKPTQDILAKNYGFNDAHIHEAHVKKVKVAKGEEYFLCTISHID